MTMLDLDALRDSTPRNPDGTFAVGNYAAIKTGERSARLLAVPDVAVAHQERVAAMVADFGGSSELSATQHALITELARLQIIAASLGDNVITAGPLTAKGNQRAALSAYLAVVGRVERLSALLGLRRVPKSPLTDITDYIEGGAS